MHMALAGDAWTRPAVISMLQYDSMDAERQRREEDLINR